MSLNEVIKRYALVSGQSEEEISKYLPIILDCMGFFNEKINENTSNADRKRLIHACAVFAYYKVNCCMSAENLNRFKAGDVEFSVDEDTVNRSKQLWLCEKEEVSDLIGSDDVVFCRVV